MNENQSDENNLLFRSIRQDDPKDNHMESQEDSAGGEEPSLFRSFMDSAQSEGQPRLFSAANDSSLSGSTPEDETHLHTGSQEIEKNDQEDLSDSAFPLFLSFKASDAVKSVTDAVRERNAAKSVPDESIPEPAPKQLDPANVKTDYDHPYDDFGGSLYIGDLEKPIFKPDSEFSKEEPVYEIPPVFGSGRDYHELSESADIFSDGRKKDTVSWDDAPDQLSGTESASNMPESRPFRQNITGAAVSRPKAKIQQLVQEGPAEDGASLESHPSTSTGTETDSSDDIKTTAPVQRGPRYSAAQQPGITPPIMTAAKSRTEKKRKPVRPFPILITLLCVTLAVVLFTMMSGNFGFASPDSSALRNGQSSAEDTAETSAKSSETTGIPEASPTPIPTAAPTTVDTTAASISETTSESSLDTVSSSTVSAQIRSGFTTSITDGKAAGDVASFLIQFKNTGGNDVSLFDGVEYITVTFAAEGVAITEVTSDAFTFTADPDKANTFIGLPVSTDIIAFRDTLPVLVTAKSDGANFGGFSVKYFVKCYE